MSPLVPRFPEPEWEERVPEELQGELLEDVSLPAEAAAEEERAPERDPAPVPEPCSGSGPPSSPSSGSAARS